MSITSDSIVTPPVVTSQRTLVYRIPGSFCAGSSPPSLKLLWINLTSFLLLARCQKLEASCSGCNLQISVCNQLPRPELCSETTTQQLCCESASGRRSQADRSKWFGRSSIGHLQFTAPIEMSLQTYWMPIFVTPNPTGVNRPKPHA